MSWIYLIVAGLLEIGWPVGLKMSQEAETRVMGILLAVGFMAASGFCLWMDLAKTLIKCHFGMTQYERFTDKNDQMPYGGIHIWYLIFWVIVDPCLPISDFLTASLLCGSSCYFVVM